MKALFIPLKREHFQSFQNGTKTQEYRVYGPRWNEQTCTVDRPAVLSLGYGKKTRLEATVIGFQVRDFDDMPADIRAALRGLYQRGEYALQRLKIAVITLNLGGAQ